MNDPQRYNSLNPEASRAYQLYLLDEYEEALEACKPAIALTPRDPLLWQIQAECFHNLGFYQEALYSYDQALNINPEIAECFYYKALILSIHDQQYSAALPLFQQSLALDSENWQTWHDYGVCLSYLNQLERAIQAFEKALELEDNPDSWYQKAEILVQQHQFKQAILAYDHAIELEPDCGDFWYQRGLALVDLNLLTEARQNYDYAVTLEPGYKYRWYNCKDCYAEITEHHI